MVRNDDALIYLADDIAAGPYRTDGWGPETLDFVRRGNYTVYTRLVALLYVLDSTGV